MVPTGTRLQRILFPELTDDEFDSVQSLLSRLQRKSTRNALRSKYYDAKQTVQHLGIAIPPQLESVETVIGWPAKSVDDLEQRIELEGFVVPGGSWSDFGLDVIWNDNKLPLESSQATTSALKYAVSFVTALAGDEGQPDVIVKPLSALGTTATWDSVNRRVGTAFSVTNIDELGNVLEFIVYARDAVVTCFWDDAAQQWRVERVPHNLGRAPVAALPFKPSLEAPFGKSRISRAVMSITDRAVRSLLRTEVSAEFYSSPQRYVLGVAEDGFTGANGETKTGWEVTLGKILALGLNEDDKNPTVGQFPQMTMQPHVDMVRADAALFSGETGIPVSALGIIHDNPASDAAMQTAYLGLVKTAERAAIPLGMGWVDVMQMAVQVRDGLSAVPDELKGMRAKYRNPATVTQAAAADAAVKFIQAFPWAAESEVALEMFGIDRVDIDRLVADKRRFEASSRLTALVDAARSIRSEVTTDGNISTGGGVPSGDAGADASRTA